MLKNLLQRQWRVLTRNKGFLGPRIGQAVFMGLLLGVVFWQLGLDDFQLTFGLLFFSAIFLSFANLAYVRGGVVLDVLLVSRPCCVAC